MLRSRQNHFTLIAVMAGLLLSGGPVLASDLEPFKASYQAYFAGMRVGKSNVELKNGDDGLVYRSETIAKGIARLKFPKPVLEVSRFDLDGTDVLPITYSFKDGTRKGKRDSTVEFDWNAGTALSRYKGEDIELPLEQGVVDRLTIQIALMLDLANDGVPDSYTLANNGRLKTYQMAKLDDESVETPAGTFETVKYRQQREGSSRAIFIYAAPALSYLPVIIEQHKDGKVQSRMELLDATGLGETQPD